MAANPESLSRGGALALLALIGLAIVGTHLALLPPHPVSVCFHDELHYQQQARDIAAGGFPRYNGVFAPKYPPLYGLVQAAAWTIGGREGFAWWSRLLNVLLLASTLVPAYRLARLELGRGWSVAAAGLALLFPFHTYVRFLLSESLLVPITLWLALAFARLCRRPSVPRALAVGVLLGLAIHTKTMMVVALPAALAALARALGSARAAIRPGGWMLVATGAVVLPYLLRAHLFPSEARVQALFAYTGELFGGGVQPLATFLHYLRAEPGLYLIALGAPVLVLSLHGLLADAGDPAPARRGSGTFVLLLTLFVTLLVSVWVAQASYYASQYHGRYFVGLWPLFALVFVRECARPRRLLRPLVFATAATALLLLAVPDALLDAARLGKRFTVIDAPGTPGAMALAAAAGGPAAFRIAGAVLAALACAYVWPMHGRSGRRWLALALLAVAGAGQLHATIEAVRRGRQVERAAHAQVAPIWTWLERLVGPGDRLVHHTFLNGLAYQNAMHFDRDLLVLRQDLAPDWNSGFEFDETTGRYRFRGKTAAGRTYLLTAAPGPAGPGLVSRYGAFRLMDITDGLAPLGRRWLDPLISRTTTEGVHPDHWCGPKARIRFPVEYPGRFEAVLILENPADSPVRGPIRVRICGPAGVLVRRTLATGQQTTVKWTGTIWTPEFVVEIETDRFHEQNGRKVGLKIEGFLVRPAP
jgi:hypothetical protein